MDSSSAFELMQALKSLAVREGKTIIASVHQPSSQAFYLFDQLLLLANGRLAFFGAGHQVVPFFASLGYPIVPHYNPADLMVEKVRQDPNEVARIVTAAGFLCKQPPGCAFSCASSCSFHHTADSGAKPSNRFIKNDDDSGRSSWTDGQSAVSFDSDRSNCSSSVDLTIDCVDASVVKCSDCSVCSQCCTCAGNCSDSGHSSQSGNTNYSCSDCQAIQHFQSSHRQHRRQNNHQNDPQLNETDSHLASFSSCNILSSPKGIKRSSASCCSSSSTSTSCSSTSSSFCSSSLDHRWPTHFYTQLHVLTRRNFCEARGRLLCKLNWLQTCGLALLAGLLWYRLPRTEHTLPDVRGYLFFSCSYWMLFAWFAALISIPPERAVLNKERASGAYRLSAFYLAKMVGELPLVVALPSLYFVLSYSLVTTEFRLTQWIALWFCMVLNSLVAQSVGLFVALACQDLQLSVTVSAVYSSAVNLFAGYYSRCLPPSLSFLRFGSLVHYAFQNMQIVEFTLGPPIDCGSVSDTRYRSCSATNVGLLSNGTTVPISYVNRNELLDELQQNAPANFWTNNAVLFAFLLLFRLLGYLVLRYVHRPK